MRFQVNFITPNGTIYKTSFYKEEPSRKTLIRACDRLSNSYGAYVTYKLISR